MQQDSPLGYGSEFQKADVLEPLFHLHPKWERFKNLLNNGSVWPLAEISKEERVKDVEETLTFGNHKGATKQPDLLKLLINDDVIHGFALPLPLDRIARIQGILLTPLNIQAQNTINDTGRIVPKDRLTHDQSYKWSYSGTSVNSRVDKGGLLPCVYGGAIRRLVNWAVAARNKYPTTRIYTTKIDFKAAYHRLHLHHQTAVQGCTQIPDLELGLLPLRFTFGGAPCPYEWGVISETICDLATAILHDNTWDPDNLQAPN